MDTSQICTAIAWAMAILYLAFQSINRRWEALGGFVVVFTALYFTSVDLKLNLLLSIVAATVVALPLSIASATVTEHFAESDATSHATDTSPTDTPPTEPDDDTNDASEGDSTNDTKEPYVDAFSTFMETYRSFTPDQIENMTSDTKDLIETQKSLLDTVKSLAPIVSQGKEMLDTFKDYFGSSKKNGGDILTMFKGAAQQKSK